MSGSRLVEAALALYPPWWRERYENEVRAVSEDLMAQGRPRTKVAGNLFMGAVSTRLKASSMPASEALWAARTRSAIATATIPWLVVQPVLMITFIGMSTWHGSVGRAQPASLASMSQLGIIPSEALLGFAVYELLFLTWLASAVVMVLGWFGFLRGVRNSTQRGRTRLTWLLMIPALSLVCAVTVFAAIGSEWHGEVPGIIDSPPSLDTLLILLWVVLVMGALASSWSIAVITKRANLSLRSLRSGKLVARIASMLLFAMVGLYATEGVIALHEPPGSTFFNGLTYSHAAWWFSCLTLLVFATCISVIASHIARRSLTTTLSLSSPN